ncbi:hypothetical protein MIZ03_0795 [Rhodoferax lithotrophicus]|uniref:Uncharacterized protein n=1 Tax=Rhodoferax lithotrophicus TaxID=2798804 RepID=A0ABN6D1M0_9BURK|nr:hypothetical protein MIZ03_0795 [Rhodoferax sp. MIZ03]
MQKAEYPTAIGLAKCSQSQRLRAQPTNHQLDQITAKLVQPMPQRLQGLRGIATLLKLQ